MVIRMFTVFRNFIQACDKKFRIEIDTLPPEGINSLPTQLWPFIWFFLRQIKGLVILLLIMELILAASVSLMLWYVGQLAKNADYGAAIIWLGLAILILRQCSGGFLHALYDLVYTPQFGNLIRRQLYWYTARQSLAYFQSRPKGSQIGAWASPQSRILNDRAILDKRVSEISTQYADAEVLPLPPFWGGYRVLPEVFEFWQGRESRLHDRVRYHRESGNWVRQRLAP